jgi:hypothetical protein
MQLGVSAPDGGILIRCVLQLDQTQRQAVDEAPSITVNWLTTNQSLASTSSKSTSRTITQRRKPSPSDSRLPLPLGEGRGEGA